MLFHKVDAQIDLTNLKGASSFAQELARVFDLNRADYAKSVRLSYKNGLAYCSVDREKPGFVSNTSADSNAANHLDFWIRNHPSEVIQVLGKDFVNGTKQVHLKRVDQNPMRFDLEYLDIW